MKHTMPAPIKGIVIDVKDELSIKTELGSLTINWPQRNKLKLGERVLILYDYERGRVKSVVRESEMSEHAEGKERVYEPDSEEDRDFEGIFDCIEGGELNS